MDVFDPATHLQTLALRVEMLLECNLRLREENQSLRQQHEQLLSERARLVTCNEQARSRVEAMITHLKSLEQNT